MSNFVHKVGAKKFIDAMDLLKMLFDQIGASSVTLGIPGGLIILGHIIILGLLYFLLESKLFKAVEGNVNGVVICIITMALVLKGKACTGNNFLQPNRNINTGILGSTLHLLGLQMAITRILTPFLYR